MNTDNEKVVSLNGTEISYRYFRGHGTPVLLVHGVGSSMDTWSELYSRLSDSGRPVVVVDLFGHGKSGAGNGDYSLGANATMLRDILNFLDIDQVHLVGHSLGGGVSMQMYYQFPDRITSLTLIASGGLGTEVGVSLRAATLPGSELVIRVISRPEVTSTLKHVVGVLGVFGIRRHGFDNRLVQTLQDLNDEARLSGFVSTLRSVIGITGQRVSALDRLTLVEPERTLIIWGDSDPMLPSAHGYALHELLPGSRMVLVTDSGHDPHGDNPELVFNELVAHIARTEDNSNYQSDTGSLL
jgi:pimeloyl-ACP methyl ester carboxylesterase